jgi:hypothetical protein
MWVVIFSIATPIIVAVLVLVLVRLLMKRAGTGLPQALGSAAGGGMVQPTRGTMHVVAASVMDRHVDIDWDHAPAPLDVAAGAAQQLADQLNQRGTQPPPPPTP